MAAFHGPANWQSRLRPNLPQSPGRRYCPGFSVNRRTRSFVRSFPFRSVISEAIFLVLTVQRSTSVSSRTVPVRLPVEPERQAGEGERRQGRLLSTIGPDLDAIGIDRLLWSGQLDMSDVCPLGADADEQI